MSRHHELQRHRRSLSEIREIMNAMKTLAFMETRKLAGFIDAQQAVVDNIETAATDFLSFYGDVMIKGEADTSVCVLIGTERGFCGDINQVLLKQFEQALHDFPSSGCSSSTPPRLIVVGHKLHQLMENDKRVSAFVPGASVAEEVTEVLQQLVEELTALQNECGALNLYAFYRSNGDAIAMRKLLPPFQTLANENISYTQAPVLNLSATELLLELTDYYLFSALNEMLYTSLMAENHRRVAHLDGAVQHLDEESNTLLQQLAATRQEEITEEIEVILLSALTKI